LAAIEKYVALKLDKSILSQFSEHFDDFPHQKSTWANHGPRHSFGPMEVGTEAYNF